MSIQRPLTELEQDVVEKVRNFGCMVMHVFSTENDKPSFSYSIGFMENVHQPEVLVYGLSRTLMHSIINEIFRQCRDESLNLHDGLRIEGLLEGYECVARGVTDDAVIAEHFGSAIWYNRRFLSQETTTAFQIVWPSAVQGLLPWDADCDQDVIASQPPLYNQGLVH